MNFVQALCIVGLGHNLGVELDINIQGHIDYKKTAISAL